MNLIDYGFEELSEDELQAVDGGGDALSSFIYNLVVYGSAAAFGFVGTIPGIALANATGNPATLVLVAAGFITGAITGYNAGNAAYNYAQNNSKK
ncbi:MAG: bacteriocin [Oscillospiraceae bacterium]|nr:bacteriocin [Oscillospiraceae bacterium]